MLRLDQPTKTHAEFVASIRAKILELQQSGTLTPDGAELYQTQVLLLLSEVERMRDKSERQAIDWLEKYHFALGRREAYTALRSMIESLLNASLGRTRAALELEREVLAREAVLPDEPQGADTEPPPPLTAGVASE